MSDSEEAKTGSNQGSSETNYEPTLTRKKTYGTKPTEICVKCSKTVYPTEKIVIKKELMHRTCLRCSYCNKQLEPSTYASAGNSQYFCKPHFQQLYRIAGDYTTGFQQLEQGLLVPQVQTFVETSPPTSEFKNEGVVKAETFDHLKKDQHLESPTGLSRKKTIKERLMLYEKRDEIAKKEENGELAEDAYDEDGNIKRKNVLAIDNDEATHLKRVESWDKLKNIVSKTEATKHNVASGIGPEVNKNNVASSIGPEANNEIVNTEKPVELKRNKTVKVYGSKPTEVCHFCNTTVYPAEKLVVEKLILHLNCLRCEECQKKLSATTYSSWNGRFWCKAHFQKIVQSKEYSETKLTHRKSRLSESGIELRGESSAGVANLFDSEPTPPRGDQSFGRPKPARLQDKNSDQPAPSNTIEPRPKTNPPTRVLEPVPAEIKVNLISESTTLPNSTEPLNALDPMEIDSMHHERQDSNISKTSKSSNPLTESISDAISAFLQSRRNPLYDRQLAHTTENIFRIVTLRVSRFNPKDWQNEKAILQKLGFNIMVADNDVVHHASRREVIISEVNSEAPDTINAEALTQIHAGDSLLEVNGRKLTGMSKTNVLKLFKVLLQPIPSSMIPHVNDQSVVSNEDTKEAQLYINPNMVIMNLTLFSRFSGLKMSYAVSSGRFKYNEVRLFRVHPESLIPKNGEVPRLPWQESNEFTDNEYIQNFASDIPKPKPGEIAPETVHYINKLSVFPYFTFEIDALEDSSFNLAEVSALAPTGLNNPKALAPLHEENIQTKKKEYRAIPPAIFIVAIKIIPESVVQSLANSIHEVMKNGQDLAAAKSFAETLFSRLPPIFRCLEGELRVGDMIWKLNEDVVTANIGESEKLKTLWTSNIKKTQIGDQHVLGVVTKNKLHPSFKAKEGTTTVSDTLYQAPPVSSTDGSCTLQ